MLTQQQLKKIIKYCPEDGTFTWKVHHGKKSVCVPNIANYRGYIQIRIYKKVYYAHRLAFLYMAGYFPENFVDHRNGITTDNRWGNLREVSNSCNMQNKKINKRNTSGFTGVSYHNKTKKWRSQITVHGKRISLGAYREKINAALARITFEDWCKDWHCDDRCENRKKVFKYLLAGS